MRCPPAHLLLGSDVLRSSIICADHGACDTHHTDLPRSGTVVHAGFDVTLSDDRVAEEYLRSLILYSLHSGPPKVLLAHHIKVDTMQDEMYFFSNAFFDWVRSDHRPDRSRIPYPPCGRPCFQLWHP